ncbi:MAG: class I SAM-dependent DNA methyltransferase, partial [Acidobacteriota bacterium]|nr:class I SAM-dependent DNA methyltransferase [Acidobacteriota bacterium]
EGGVIYEASRALPWPGEASILVAVVHLTTEYSEIDREIRLDGKVVNFINSRLLPSPELPDPLPLASNDLLGFEGADLRSSGFILDRAEYLALALDEKNLDCLMPFLGGEEVNRSPTQTNERFAINFGSMPLATAETYPALLRIVNERVKPARDRAKDHGPGKQGKKFWWQYALRADPLYYAIRDLDRCLVAAISSTHLSFSFQPTRQVFPHSLAVFAFEAYGSFACLQSRIHFLWANLLSSRFWGALRYSLGDAFRTFPFPRRLADSAVLENAGREYYEFRSALMLRNGEGLTRTYNRFHDPEESNSDILKLRELHAVMDGAVLDHYGWNDIQTDCEFLLDHEIVEEEWGDKKRPYRYRWPDEVRDQVLARLLELNVERAREEARSGAVAEKETRGKKARSTKSSRSIQTKELF